MNDPNQFNNPPPGGMPPQGAPGGFPPPGGAPYQQPPAGGGGTPGIVIAGLICAFLCPLLGLILSIIGRKKAQEAGAGVGMATAGIIISAVFIVISIIANIAAA